MSSTVKMYIREVGRRARDRFEPNADRSFTADIAGHLQVAAEHAHMGTELPPGTRLRGAKHAVLRGARSVTYYQVRYNRAVLEALAELELATGASVPGGVAAAVASFEVQLQELAERMDTTVAAAHAARDAAVAEVDRARAEVRHLRAEVVEVRQRHTRTESELRQLRSLQDLVLREVRQAGGLPLGESGLTEVSRRLDHRFDDLYQDLEDTFRGSREHVRSLVAEYVADVKAAADGGGSVVDIGCGRGEWLEVLRDADITAYGVDLNETFVEANTARGLDVRVGDALEHLRSVEPSSLAAVTAFHVAEHLAMDDLVELVDASLRALRPGGVLVMETPNPVNLRVGATQFYIDPTHLKPLHPQFLEFLVTSRGFVDVQLRYLHPMSDPPLTVDALGDADPAGAAQLIEVLNWALFGPQDFAVLGRKVT
ncbi:MAG: class I SAM-dependent methyltransferase [Acidimicrobiales bacterium]